MDPREYKLRCVFLCVFSCVFLHTLYHTPAAVVRGFRVGNVDVTLILQKPKVRRRASKTTQQCVRGRAHLGRGWERGGGGGIRCPRVKAVTCFDAKAFGREAPHEHC